ncbi:hypothetical protein MW887_003167 [Aspergillus wentii]|nr:hypothetical protein MW887_003167 [Aspergillus wentii]
MKQAARNACILQRRIETVVDCAELGFDAAVYQFAGVQVQPDVAGGEDERGGRRDGDGGSGGVGGGFETLAYGAWEDLWLIEK